MLKACKKCHSERNAMERRISDVQKIEILNFAQNDDRATQNDI